MEGENYRGRRNRQPVQTPPQTNRVHHLLRVVAGERRANYPIPRPVSSLMVKSYAIRDVRKTRGATYLKKVDPDVGARRRNR